MGGAMLSKSLTNFLLMDGAVFPPCSLPGAKLWWDFLGGSEGKVSVFDAGDLGSVPALERSLGEGNGNPLQYYCLENPMDRGAWLATVYGVAKSQTQLSDFTFTFKLWWR